MYKYKDNEGLVDLHVHTTASDGTLTPTEIVAYAKSKNLRAVAITDHDTIGGLEEALGAGDRLNFPVIPGVEISVDHQGKEMHILGYYIDIASDDLKENLQKLQDYRRERNPKMIRKLQELGFKINLAEVEAEAGGPIIGRPHFASVLVNKGYVRDKQEAFDKYLAGGMPGYVKKEKLVPREGIELILRAGGMPVLAHPKYLKEQGYAQLAALLSKLKSFGLQGIEAFYPNHDARDTETYLRLAAEHRLLVTGGTDFHGANKPDIDLGTGTGELQVPYEVVLKMEELRSGADGR